MNHRLGWGAIVCCGVLCRAASPGFAAAPAVAPSPHAQQQFERDVRPLLVKHCVACHGPKKSHNGLRVDGRAELLKGGDSGPAVVPGQPEKSLLIEAVEHRSFEMPPAPAEPLKAQEIAALELWIRNGAPWPTEPSAATRDTLTDRARKFWGFRPVQNPAPPAVRNPAWSQHPIDRFLAARWEAAKLEPAADADPQTLIRRVSFVLTGLPPTPDEVDAFVRDAAGSPAAAEQAYGALVDRLLASPRFGQHWARHWMDWVRYCESHGSEGDPPIPFAWRYRDYLIRALNADVPYDQLIREHLAGDLLARPRINAALGINESILGTAHLRFVEHGYQPVDAREDLIKFTDNQIDVATKAFQALTVSCARCHDHKFDAISQRDFYALFPVFVASRPAQVQIDLPERLHRHDARLQQIKLELRKVVAESWLASLDDFPARFKQILQPGAVEQAARRLEHPLHAWTVLKDLSGQKFPEAWEKLTAQYDGELGRRRVEQEKAVARRIVVDDAELKRWHATGAGAPSQVSPAGEFTVAVAGENVIDAILRRGVYTHRLSSKHGAVVTSPPFRIEHDAVSVRIQGSGYGTARLIVENYAVPRGGIYAMTSVPMVPGQQWFTWNTTFWRGFEARIELATYDDLTISGAQYRKGAIAPPTDGRSSIGISEIWFHNAKVPPAAAIETRLAGAWVVHGAGPKSVDELSRHYQELTRTAINAWRQDTLADEQAELLDALLQVGVLPNTSATLPAARASWAEYRHLEAEIPVARRAPGVIETAGWDEPLMIRGDYHKPGEIVPRRYLEALGGKSIAEVGSGRLKLAEQIAAGDNPLTSRVAVNRLWNYVFGRGIVATVDNFGELGSKPTHPELLDHLATRFVTDGWSLKKSIRYLAMSRSFRLASTPSAAAKKHDPENIWLTHALVRRLEAEAIRDSLLAVAGRLKTETDEGPGYNDNEPPHQQTRRSVFVTIRRTALPALLEVFDAPKPFTTLGARDVTNVPGQALTLLNDRLVLETAKHWARAQMKIAADRPADRIRDMYRQALAREPDAEDLAAAERYVADLAATYHVPFKDSLRTERVWQDFAHALFNLKEFIYVR
ncbi:MAG TPA: PSD1 and planctomycete cytochrome C domain-containing protein [Pirellulales bacterium]|jgi:cytochrome c553|nr:PSD1 and planctomycete cytochrome C domain-containing protein [Pirellulales bacterium]